MAPAPLPTYGQVGVAVHWQEQSQLQHLQTNDSAEGRGAQDVYVTFVIKSIALQRQSGGRAAAAQRRQQCTHAKSCSCSDGGGRRGFFWGQQLPLSYSPTKGHNGGQGWRRRGGGADGPKGLQKGPKPSTLKQSLEESTMVFWSWGRRLPSGLRQVALGTLRTKTFFKCCKSNRAAKIPQSLSESVSVL